MSESGIFLVSIPRPSMHTWSGTSVKPVHRNKKKHRTQLLRRCYCKILILVLVRNRPNPGSERNRFLSSQKPVLGPEDLFVGSIKAKFSDQRKPGRKIGFGLLKTGFKIGILTWRSQKGRFWVCTNWLYRFVTLLFILKIFLWKLLIFYRDFKIVTPIGRNILFDTVDDQKFIPLQMSGNDSEAIINVCVMLFFLHTYHYAFVMSCQSRWVR